jgi:hypothetical protein
MMAIGGGETRRAKPTSFSQRDYNRRRVRSLMQVLTDSRSILGNAPCPLIETVG